MYLDTVSCIGQIHFAHDCLFFLDITDVRLFDVLSVLDVRPDHLRLIIGFPNWRDLNFDALSLVVWLL